MRGSVVTPVKIRTLFGKSVLLGVGVLLLAGCFFTGSCATERVGDHVTFGRLGFQARSVVYILQSSGAAIDSWKVMTRLVDDSINGLRPTQRYDVIWIKPGGEAVSVLGGLRSPDRKNRATVFHTLKALEPRGNVVLWPAIQLAYARRPDAILLFASGGDLEPDLLAKVTGTKSPPVPIYACSVLTDMSLMKSLSDISGGEYLYVTEADVELLNE